MWKASKRVAISLSVGLILLSSGTALAWSAVTKTIQVQFSHIQLIVNGKAMQPKAEPFLYNGVVYAPVASVANALGAQTQWDQNARAVRMTQPPGFKEMAAARAKDGITEDNFDPKYEQLYDTVYLGTAIGAGSQRWAVSVKNYATMKEVKLPRVTPDGKPIVDAQIIPGMAWAENANVPPGHIGNGNFGIREKASDGTEYISIYSLQNDQLQRLSSTKFETPKGLYANLSGTRNYELFAHFYKDDLSGTKLVGTRIYHILKGREIDLYYELFQ